MSHIPTHAPRRPRRRAHPLDTDLSARLAALEAQVATLTATRPSPTVHPVEVILAANRSYPERLARMFAQWEAEDADIDPAEAEASWQALQRALNQSRVPEPPLFPDV